MQGKIERKKIDWERASCKGLDTELFYTPLSELLADGYTYKTLRNICFNCPIWEDCLKIGVQEEQYGFWGGLSEEERKHLYNGTKPRSMKQLEMDLKLLNISLKDILKIIKNVKRNFLYPTGVKQ